MGWGLNWLRVFLVWLICWVGLGMWFALMDLDQFWTRACWHRVDVDCRVAWRFRFRPAGRVTFSRRGKSNQKRFAPASGPALRAGSFAPSPLQGSAYKGLPWPFKPFAASMRLTPLRNDSALPTEGARVGPATIFNRRMMTISRPVSFVGNVLYGFPSYWILAITDLQATSIAPFRRPNVIAT